MRFKKIILVFSLLVVSTLSAQLQVGEPVNFYVNNFRLIMSRDTLPKVGVVRSVLPHFYLVSAGQVAVNRIVRVNFPDNVSRLWISVKRLPGQGPLYIYTSDDGINWIQNRALSGMDTKFDKIIIGTDTVPQVDMDVFDIKVVNDIAVDRLRFFYIATSDGLYSMYTMSSSNPSSAKLEGFVDSTTFRTTSDTAIYEIAINPFTQSNMGSGLVMFVATAHGVFRVVTQGLYSPSTYSPLGSLTDTVWTIAIDPSDSSKILVGTSNGVYKWQNNDWQSAGINTGKVYKIRFDTSSNSFYVASDRGIFVTADYGNSWSSLGSFDYPVSDVILVNGTLYATLIGGGVYKSTDNGNSWADFSSGLENLSYLGSKNVYTIFHDSTGLYIGCDEGVYHYEENLNKWENVSNGIGSLMTDRTVSTVSNILWNDSLGIDIFDSIINALGIDPNILVDVDNDSHIYIVLTRLVQTSNATDPTVIPVYGYFDPRDEDLFDDYSTKKEVLVVDLSKFVENGVIKQSKLQAFIGYLLARYAVWSVDMEANPAELTGVAAWAALKAGLDISNGISGGYSYLSNKGYLNGPLLDYTHQWLNSPVAREIDRERMLLWFEYLSERYGDSVITHDVLYGGLRGYRNLNEIIKKYSNGKDSLFTLVPKWYVALTFNQTFYIKDTSGNIVDTIYKYNPPFDMSVDNAAITDIPSPDEHLSTQVLAPGGFSVWRDAISDTTGLRFNARDGDQDFIKIFMYCSGDSIMRLVDLDSLGRFSITVDPATCGAFKYVIANVNVHKTIPYYISEDTTRPNIVGIYALQNPGNPRMVQMYVAGFDKIGDYFSGLMSDVNVPNPIVTFRNISDTTQAPRNYNMKLLSMGDSIFTYFTPILLDLNGDIEVSLTAQDLPGNDARPVSDTISVQSVSERGGTYVALGGKVIMTVPEHAFGYSPSILIDKIDKFIADKLYPQAESGLSDVYVIGNSRIVGSKDITLKIKAEGNIAKASVYYFDHGVWTPLRTFYDDESGYYVFNTHKFGAFQLRTGTPEHLKFKFEVVNGPIIYGGKNIKLSLSLDRSDFVSISFYNAAGRMVKRIVNGKLNAGTHDFEINSYDMNLTSGVYFIRLRSTTKRIVRKIVFLKD